MNGLLYPNATNLAGIGFLLILLHEREPGSGPALSDIYSLIYRIRYSVESVIGNRMESGAMTAVEKAIRSIPDYPKPGIIFRDITPVLKDRDAFRACIEALKAEANGMEIDYVVGIDARGFIIGAALAYELRLGFIPARKKGKLPYRSVSAEYTLEYGTATLEMHEDALGKGDRVLVVDDLLATGGTAAAVGKLVERLGAKVKAYAFVVELPDLGGRKRLGNTRIISLVRFRGE